MARISDPRKSKYFAPLCAGMASGSTIAELAAEIGLSEAYAYDLSRQPAVKQKVNELRTAMMDQVVAQLAEASATAVGVLSECMTAKGMDRNEIENQKIRLSGAKVTLERVLPLSENLDLRRRIDVLERVAREAEPHD